MINKIKTWQLIIIWNVLLVFSSCLNKDKILEEKAISIALNQIFEKNREDLPCKIYFDGVIHAIDERNEFATQFIESINRLKRSNEEETLNEKWGLDINWKEDEKAVDLVLKKVKFNPLKNNNIKFDEAFFKPECNKLKIDNTKKIRVPDMSQKWIQVKVYGWMLLENEYYVKVSTSNKSLYEGRYYIVKFDGSRRYIDHYTLIWQ